MIDYLYVNNFKTLVNFRIEFNNIQVLLGKNGCGKTSVLYVLSLLRDFVLGKGNAILSFEESFLTRWVNSNIQTFELGVSYKDQQYIYSLEIEHDIARRQKRVVKETVTANGKQLLEARDGNVVLWNDNRGLLPSFKTDGMNSALIFSIGSAEMQLLSEFKNFIASLVIVTVDPTRMNDRVEMEMSIPDTRFTNIAAVYTFLSQAKPEVISRIWNQLREINATFDKTRIYMDVYGKQMIADYHFAGVDVSFSIRELSDGERMLLALYILLFGYIEQGIPVFIDEPDNYISLREIQPWCSAVEDACRNKGQCVLVSHHPEVIDYYAKESGIWMARLRSGESIIQNNPVKRSEADQFMKYSEIISGGYLDEA